ncbi:MAG: DUF2796 domain-containing protein [Porticoccaceae bacterium]|nr:DUF2796 domain-containing protein [Porticoccaceae bacterium]
MTIFPNISLLVIMFLIALKAGAESAHHHHDHDLPQQDAHLHGYVELTLALERGSLEIHLESPAVNIIGFEHKATSQKQLQTIEQARQTLEASVELFSFDGGDCSLKQATADFPALAEHSAHDEEEHKTTEESHSEITAHFEYDCEQDAGLDSINVNLIDHFPTIEKIKAMWVTDVKQGAVELTAKSNIIRLR